MQNKNPNPIPSIIYESPRSHDRRSIVVINGQPYYQSTGINSNAPGVWFPIFMTQGTHKKNFKNLAKTAPQFSDKNLWAFFGENYLHKYEAQFIEEETL